MAISTHHLDGPRFWSLLMLYDSSNDASTEEYKSWSITGQSPNWCKILVYQPHLGVLCVPCRHIFDMQKNGVHQHLVVGWPEWCEPTNPGISASPETGGQWDPDPCSTQGVDSLEDQIFRSRPHLRATQWPFSNHRPIHFFCKWYIIKATPMETPSSASLFHCSKKRETTHPLTQTIKTCTVVLKNYDDPNNFADCTWMMWYFIKMNLSHSNFDRMLQNYLWKVASNNKYVVTKKLGPRNPSRKVTCTPSHNFSQNFLDSYCYQLQCDFEDSGVPNSSSFSRKIHPKN